MPLMVTSNVYDNSWVLCLIGMPIKIGMQIKWKPTLDNYAYKLQ